MRVVAAALVLAAAALELVTRRVPPRRQRAWRAPAATAPARRGPVKVALLSAAGALVGAALGIASPYLFLPGAVGGALVPVAGARIRATATTSSRAATIAPLVDLVAVGTAAGHTPANALVRAAAHAPADARRMLAAPVTALALGTDLGTATRDARGIDPGLDALLDILVRGAALGSPVAPQLGDLAGRLRAAHMRTAQEHARTVPVRLLFPLVLLVLPSFVLLGVVPLLLGTAAGLRSP